MKVRDEAGAEIDITIVGVDEAEPLAGRISWIAPMAKALLKSRVGDVVTFLTPEGLRELEVLNVSYGQI